jgi:site-specific DNA-cytosine methylase
MTAYYNEFDPYAAQWLTNLVEAGHIARGQVDSRSILEVTRESVGAATQAHFFAGIGVWSHALRLAGWPDDRPVWTGSCPCQPFSVAGRRRGTGDERHLWPEWRRLIATCKPPTIFGEQVASADGRAWLDQVRFDLEHIEFWSDYYEGVHELLAAQTVEQLSSLLGSLLGRTEARLRRLPASVRGSVESGEQGASQERAGAQSREGESVQVGVRRQEPRPPLGDGGGSTEQAQRPAMRLVELFDRIGRAGSARSLRDDGPAFLLSQQSSELEQPVAAPSRPVSGVRVLEHSSHLLRDERSSGKLGRGLDEAVCRSVVTEECLNDERRIAEAFGALLASSDGRVWLDAVRADLEALGYAVGAADLCAAGVGAPHIRQRLYFGAVRLGDTSGARAGRDAGAGPRAQEGTAVRAVGDAPLAPGPTRGMGDDDDEGLEGQPWDEDDRGEPGRDAAQPYGPTPTSGFWSDPDWVLCRDEPANKWRPVEPGTFPLAHGAPARVGPDGSMETQPRVGKLRAYGNAIVAPVAATFIRSVMDVLDTGLKSN